MTIRKALIGLAAIAALAMGSLAFASPAAAADHAWGPHMAISLHGYQAYYAEGSDEDDARSQAMFLCQQDYGGNGCTRGTSVPLYENWSVVAIACGNNGRPFSGGSQAGYGSAYQHALQKAANVGYGSYQCSEIGNW